MPSLRLKVSKPLPSTLKSVARSAIAIAAIATASIAPAAFGQSDLLIDREISVSIKVGDLKTQDGIASIYERLERRASQECRADRDALDVLGETVDDCRSDLIAQFVINADLASLTAYHTARPN